MTNYSYVGMRLDTGNMGKIHHQKARSQAVRLYNQDLKIAKQCYDALNKASHSSVVAPDGKVEFVGDAKLSHPEVGITHKMMGDFHTKRAMATMESAMRHTALASQYATNEAVETDDTKSGRMPSLFDVHEAADHDFEKAFQYHATLHGAAVVEAHNYRAVADGIQGQMDAETDPKKTSKMTEAMSTCHELYKMWSHIAEMNLSAAGDFRRRLSDKANDTFYRDDSNEQNAPHKPDYSDDPTGGINTD